MGAGTCLINCGSGNTFIGSGFALKKPNTFGGGLFIGTGQNNCIYGAGSFIGTGTNNVICDADSSVIISGYGNKINDSAHCSGIISGHDSEIPANCCFVMIAGDCITADRECATFVNNLSIKDIPTSSAGLPSGSVWNNSGVLNIVT